MNVVTAKRLYAFSGPGSLGPVVDTRYVRCFWPRLDRPTPIFAPGSSGIEVEGPPTPRNVIFPAGTVFRRIYEGHPLGQCPRTRSDCFFLSEFRDEPMKIDEPRKMRLEVEPGVVREVDYTVEVERSVRCRCVYELTTTEASRLRLGLRTFESLRDELRAAGRVVKERA